MPAFFHSLRRRRRPLVPWLHAHATRSLLGSPAGDRIESRQPSVEYTKKNPFEQSEDDEYICMIKEDLVETCEDNVKLGALLFRSSAHAHLSPDEVAIEQRGISNYK